MSSLSSTIYDHVLLQSKLANGVARCTCGVEFMGEERVRWSAHLAGIIDDAFVNVTRIPAGPAALPQPVEEAAEVSISINGELHSVIYVRSKKS